MIREVFEFASVCLLFVSLVDHLVVGLEGVVGEPRCVCGETALEGN